MPGQQLAIANRKPVEHTPAFVEALTPYGGVRIKSGDDRNRICTPKGNSDNDLAHCVHVGGEKFGAFSEDMARFGTDLLAVIDAWPTLSADARVSVLALIEQGAKR